MRLLKSVPAVLEALENSMEKEEMKELIAEMSKKIVRLEALNEQAFITILQLTKQIRELEEMTKVKRI